jgi:hypothetical protein
MGLYGDAKFRNGSQALVRYSVENGMLPVGSTTLPNAPVLTSTQNLLGYVTSAGIRAPEGSQGIEVLGDYRDIDLVLGARSPSMSLALTLGNAAFLPWALRDGHGVNSAYTHHCLPVIAFALAFQNRCGSNTAASWLLRYGLINSLSLQAQNGSAAPVTANVEIMGIALQTPKTNPVSPSNLTATPEELKANGRSTLTWHHTSWISGGTDYRTILESVSISIQNSVQPAGSYRLDYGLSNPLSRTPEQIRPGQQKLQVSYRFRDYPTQQLIDQVQSSAVQLVATNPYSTNPQTFVATIGNSLLNEESLDNISPNGDLMFSIPMTARLLTMAVA